MTNKQLAAVRKAINRFPGLEIAKDGERLTPYRLDNRATTGVPVTVTDTMTEAQIIGDITASCEAIA